MTDLPDDPIVYLHQRNEADIDFGRDRRSIPSLATITASVFAKKPVPPRPWLIKDVIPDHTVTILSGDGGTGKSLLALQLGVAVATGGQWIGHEPEHGGVVYLSAEDDVDEVHRRLADITAAVSVSMENLSHFHLVPLAGKDAVLGVSDRGDVVTPTSLWSALAAKVRVLCPKLLIVDNLADVFGGNENSRPQARQFIGLLRGLAIKQQMTVLLIAHPSLTGLSSGTGTSGSTAWSNSVRSRLYLERVKAEAGDEPDPSLRVLRVMKANYAPAGSEIRMKWVAGSFEKQIDSALSFEASAKETKADRVFLHLVRRFAMEDQAVSDRLSPSYAPAVFAEQEDAEALGKKTLERAMKRLLTEGRIRVEQYGPPSRRHRRIVLGEVQ